MDDYFITGYTGFCPDIADHIGHSYHKATREVMKAHPHVKTRLASVYYPSEFQKNKGDYDACCSMPAEYMPVYHDVPLDINWRSCQGDGGSCCNNAIYPEQAYPLSCSEWESPCLTKHCNEMYAPCLRRPSYSCTDQARMPSRMSYAENVQQPCCISCAKGGRCIGDVKSEASVYKYPKSEVSCYKYPKSEASNYKYPKKKYLSSQNVMAHRTGGVIPNYMGHIPGMQDSFGEPYAIAARRLLRRHFDELQRKGVMTIK